MNKSASKIDARSRARAGGNVTGAKPVRAEDGAGPGGVPTEGLETLRRRFIETAGQTTQSMGAGRNLGQIFAYVYLRAGSSTLNDLTRDLGVSKGSASMTVRQLEQWGALRRVWVKGDRKDHYEASEDFGRFIRRALLDLVEVRVEAVGGFLEEAEEELRALGDGTEADAQELAFVRERLRVLKKFRDRARWIWDRSITTLLDPFRRTPRRT